MGKAVYLGVDGRARKVKKMYLGADGKARKVKKGYIGVGGVARPFFTSEQKPVYYGKAPSLYEKVFRPAGAQTSSYALFAGGYTGGVTTDSVTEYSESLTRSSNRLGETKYRMVSVSHKGYAIFSGGYYEDADDHSGALESADMFDPNSTRIALPTLPRTTVDGAGAGIGNYAIVMNGYGSRPYYGYAYTIPSGTLVTSLPNLTNERKHSMGASTDTYAIIAGGHVMGRYSGDEVSVKTVEGYNSSLTKSVASSGMDTATWFGTSIKFGSYALFAGGTSNEDRNDGYTISNQATAFSGSMTRVYFPSLSYQRMNLASSVVGDYVLFAGGKPTKYSTGEDSATDVVEIFDKSFTKVYGVSNLPNKTSNLVGASVGNYALFGGGEIYIPGERNLKTTDIVEAYTLV